MIQKTAIVWFRQDLRRHDNAALLHAIAEGFSVLPVYILDDVNAGDWKMGGASRWWLHQSLTKLDKSFSGHMHFYKGDAAKIISKLVKDSGAEAVFWNRCYEPWRIARDKDIKDALTKSGVETKSFNSYMLWEPWEVLKDDGTPYKVFTPYYRKGCLSRAEPHKPRDSAARISYAKFQKSGGVDDLGLMPDITWYKGMEAFWMPGEEGALKRLEEFIDDELKGYKLGRNFPTKSNVSKLSPYLHYGEISVNKVWHDIRHAGVAQRCEADADNFCSELGWREFSNYLLYYCPTLPEKPLQKKFEKFPWDKNAKALQAWQRGQTGIPIVDAGMRQLWQTGWMHNRVRMVVASFLIKNLLIHWREGEDWFWDTLVDADLANNAASWQWVAGSGADAAPYFRVFNPVTQGERFDPDGAYVRHYVPELQNVPDKYIHCPWDSPNPPANYPAPIVDLKESRVRALEAFQTIRN